MSNYIDNLKNKFDIIKLKYHVNNLALFGSVTREDFDPVRSDIDIMVDFTGEDVLEFIALAEELEKITGRKVDLVSKRSLKPRQLEYLEKEFVYV
jgi:predicted nucleotidyltransferase